MKKIISVAICILIVTCFAVVSGCTSSDKRTSYNVVCELNDNVLTGQEEVKFYNDTGTSLKELKFNLYPNAFRKDAEFLPVNNQNYYKAYYKGESYGNIEITSVSILKKETEYIIGGKDKNVLTVNLTDELFPEESVNVKIEFTVTLAYVNCRTGITEKTVNLGNFYPILCAYDNGFYECEYCSNGDPFFSECADYNVKITCDSEYVIASSGKIQSSKTANGKQTNVYKANDVRSFAFVLSKDFESVTDDSFGFEVTYYFYDDKNPKNALEHALKAIKTFTEKFGEYKYETYSVVQTAFIEGGMEYPSLVMISDELEGESYGEVIVHETAHQWWQTTVGTNETENAFLDEGLAEYSTVIFYENNPEYKMTREYMIESAEQTYRVFCSVYNKLFTDINTTMNRKLSEFTSEYEYVNVSYIKSCIMFDYLRKSIGDDAFFKGLKNFYSDFTFKNATVYDLIGEYEKIGKNVGGFFDSFISGKVII